MYFHLINWKNRISKNQLRYVYQETNLASNGCVLQCNYKDEY